MTFPDQRGTTERGNIEVGSEPTLGELGRRLDRMDQNNSQHFGKIFERLDGLDDRFVTRREFDAQNSRISKMTGWIVTGIVCPLVVAVILFLILGTS